MAGEAPLQSAFSFKTVTLAAGKTLEVAVTGNYFIIVDSTAATATDLQMKFSPTSEQFPVRVGYGFRLLPGDIFKKLWFFNQGELELEFSYFACFGEVIDARLNTERTNNGATGYGLPVSNLDGKTFVLPAGFTSVPAGASNVLPGTAAQDPPLQRRAAIITNEHATDPLQLCDLNGTPFTEVMAKQTQIIETSDPLIVTVPGANAIPVHAGEIFYLGALAHRPTALLWPSATPFSYYKLDAINQNVSPDALGLRNLGQVLRGGDNLPCTVVAGLIGNAVWFQGAYNIVGPLLQRLNEPGWDFTTSFGFTIRVWAKLPQPGAFLSLRDQNASTLGPVFELANGGAPTYNWLLYYQNGVGNSQVITAASTADTWQCLYAWFDLSGAQPKIGLQVNAQPAVVVNWTQPYSLAFHSLTLGGILDTLAANFTNGGNVTLDEVCLWAGPLSLSARLVDYNYGQGYTYTP